MMDLVYNPLLGFRKMDLAESDLLGALLWRSCCLVVMGFLILQRIRRHPGGRLSTGGHRQSRIRPQESGQDSGREIGVSGGCTKEYFAFIGINASLQHRKAGTGSV
jgi:hypothetical protein